MTLNPREARAQLHAEVVALVPSDYALAFGSLATIASAEFTIQKAGAHPEYANKLNYEPSKETHDALTAL
jgi:hypothetical protein